jgi:hypothetical protein
MPTKVARPSSDRNAASAQAALAIMGRRSTLGRIRNAHGVPLSDHTYEGLLAYKRRLRVMQRFVDLLLQVAVTKDGKPRKQRLDQFISEELAAQLLAKAEAEANE